MRRQFCAAVALCVICSLPASAAVNVPNLFSDHMVLQRDLPIIIWGTANPRESITVKIVDKTAAVTADA